MDYAYQYASLVLDGNGTAESTGKIGIKLDGTQPFTIDAWVRPEDVYERTMIISQSSGLCMGIDNKQLFFYMPGYPSVYSSTPDEVFVDGEWVHLCAVYNTSAITLYLNGVSDTFAAVGGSGVYKEDSFIFGDNFQGLIRQVRIFNCALSSDQVNTYLLETDLSNEEFKNSLAAYYDFSNIPILERITEQKISLKNTAELRLFATGALFQGNSFFTIDGEPYINPAGKGNDSYTVQAWVFTKLNEFDNRYTIFANGDVTDRAGMSLYIEREENAYYVKALRDDGIEGDAIIVSSSPVRLNQWINIAVTYAVDTMKLYVDGELSSSIDQLYPVYSTLSNQQPRIGAEVVDNNVNGQDWFTGCISRLDVWDRELSAEEINLYASESPDVDADGLLACYAFHQKEATNTCSGQLLGVRNSVTFGEVCVQASNKLPFCEDGMNSKRNKEPLQAWQLAQFRSQALGGNAMDEDNKLIYTVTSHVLGDTIYFVAHDKDTSYTICYGDASELDPVTVWNVELVLIVVGGVLSLIFGVSINAASKNLLIIINKVAQNPLIRTVVSGEIGLNTIIEIFKILYNSGNLTDILKTALINYSFWKRILVIGKVVLLAMASAVGGWVYYLTILGALVVAIFSHMTKYPRRKIPNIGVSAISFHGIYEQHISPTIPLSNNGIENIAPPEWRSNIHGANRLPSHAAYRLDRLQNFGEGIKIRASFESNTLDAFMVTVRCVCQDNNRVFGISNDTFVEVRGGRSEPYDFTFPNHHLGDNGVRLINTTFRWEVIDENNDEVPIGDTQHRFYITLKAPARPWDMDVRFPWVDALRYPCLWANGAMTEEAAASLIISHFNRHLNLRYDNINHYGNAETRVNLTRFLGFLEQGVGPEHPAQVNCSDCAGLCATFASAIGSSLCQIRLTNPLDEIGFGNGFFCYPIVLIGENDFAIEQPHEDNEPPWVTFQYHDLCLMLHDGEALNGKVNDLKVYDACLCINGDTPPDDIAGDNRLLPTGMKLSIFADDEVIDDNDIPENESYRDHLARRGNDNRPQCVYRDNMNGDEFKYKQVQ